MSESGVTTRCSEAKVGEWEVMMNCALKRRMECDTEASDETEAR